MSTSRDDNQNTDFIYESGPNQWGPPSQGFPPPIEYPHSPQPLSGAPFYLPNVIAAIIASIGIVIGSIGLWASTDDSVGTHTVYGMDFRGNWGLVTLVIGAGSAVALFTQVNWGRTTASLRWAVPLAWLVLVAGVACLAIALVNIAFVSSVTAFSKAAFGIDHLAQVGWGLWLVAICSALLCVTGAIVAVQVGNASQDHSLPSQAAWAGAWRWVAIAASALIFVVAIINAYRPLMLNGGSSEQSTATETVTAEPSTSTVIIAPRAPAPVVADAAVPTDAKRCSGNPVNVPFNNSAAGDVTSCPFAEAVRIQYLRQGSRDGSTVTLNVFSPVTSQSYLMTCAGNHVVVCTGGNKAVVYIY